MKVIVLAANGKAGRLITEEAVARGMDVVGVVREEAESVAPQTVHKDIFDLTKADLADADVVVDALGAWTPETAHTIVDAVKHLASLLRGVDTRLLVVGGAGSLFVDDAHTKTVAMTTPFPAEAMPVIDAHQEALDALRRYTDVNWTYVSPAGDFRADGKKTGKYILGGEKLILNSRGESVISYADYAVAFVDEIENGSHIRERISVVGE